MSSLASQIACRDLMSCTIKCFHVKHIHNVLAKLNFHICVNVYSEYTSVNAP